MFYLQKLLKHLLFMYVMKTIGSVYNNNNYYCSTNFMFIFAKKKEGACSLYMLSIVQRRKPPQPTLLALHCAILLLTREGAGKVCIIGQQTLTLLRKVTFDCSWHSLSHYWPF